jgi:hypothetical protein
MMQPLERRRGLPTSVLAILIAGVASHVSAAVLCGRRNAATAEIADGATLKLRTACKSNELPVNPASAPFPEEADCRRADTETVT